MTTIILERVGEVGAEEEIRKTTPGSHKRGVGDKMNNFLCLVNQALEL